MGPLRLRKGVKIATVHDICRLDHRKQFSFARKAHRPRHRFHPTPLGPLNIDRVATHSARDLITKIRCEGLPRSDPSLNSTHKKIIQVFT
jgi:hypothetical protein